MCKADNPLTVLCKVKMEMLYTKRFMSGVRSTNSEAHRAITLLQERRTALISAAVTGKSDVRGYTDFSVMEAA